MKPAYSMAARSVNPCARITFAAGCKRYTRALMAVAGKTLLIAVFAMVAIGTDTADAQSISTAPFTQAQADAGREIYSTSCASCHSEDLSGKGAPALAGKAFMASNFGQHTVADLYSFIQKSMPFCEGGTLAAESYTNVVAFILEANGAKPGDQPLTPTTNTKISDIATGDMPAGFLSGMTPK